MYKFSTDELNQVTCYHLVPDFTNLETMTSADSMRDSINDLEGNVLNCFRSCSLKDNKSLPSLHTIES